VGDGHDTRRVDIEGGAQAQAGRLRHDDHLVGQGHGIDQHVALVGRGIAQNGVGDHDGRDPQVGQHFEHFVAIGTAEETVFVLDHRDVTLVEQLGGRRHGRRRTVVQLADHTRRGSPCPIGDPDDAHLGTVARQPVGQRSREGGQAAGGRGVTAQDPKGGGAAERAVDRRDR
jgi:hypothetical protein